MIKTIILFIVLAVLFILSTALVEKVYQSGHQINSFLVGGASFVVLILGQIFFTNPVVMYGIQVLFLFGTIIFFMSATRNYKLLMSGEGNGWLAKKVKRLRAANQKHS